MAGFLGEPTVLIDINDGPAAVAAGIEAAARHLGLRPRRAPRRGRRRARPWRRARARQPAGGRRRAGRRAGARAGGPASPRSRVRRRLRRRADPRRGRASGWPRWTRPAGIVDVLRPRPEHLDRLEAALAFVPTEASAMAARAARGETGVVDDPRRAAQRAAHAARRRGARVRPVGRDRVGVAARAGRPRRRVAARGQRDHPRDRRGHRARLRGAGRGRVLSMPWVETTSPSFSARHELDDDADVVEVLQLLEGTRERLGSVFETPARRGLGRDPRKPDAARPRAALSSRSSAG